MNQPNGDENHNTTMEREQPNQLNKNNIKIHVMLISKENTSSGFNSNRCQK